MDVKKILLKVLSRLKKSNFIWLLPLVIIGVFLFLLNSCEIVKNPTVVTEPVNNILATSAISGGTVTNDGGAPVISRGVCWSTSENPTISSGTKSIDGQGTGTFTSTITGLSPTTGYYVRAYAVNSEGAGYGEQIPFTTTGYAPVADFAASPATITAGQSVQFTDQSTNTPTSWSWNFGDSKTSTGQNPAHTYETAGTYTVTLTAANSYGTDSEIKSNYITVNPAGVAPVAAFTASSTIIITGQSVQFTDQSSNTPTSWSWSFGDGGTSTSKNPAHPYSSAGTYTVKLTAANSFGSDTETKSNYITVNEGNSGTFTDSRDGKVYNWIRIGNQVWMAENLAYLPSVNLPSSVSYTVPYYYIYDYNGTGVSEAKATSNYTKYGVLYNWPAAMNSSAGSSANPSGVKGACPNGWHLPSDAEWKELEIFIGISQSEANNTGWRGTDQGTQLKATKGWINEGNGTNTRGFTALPGGYLDTGGIFSSIEFSGRWWTATEYDDTHSWERGIYCDYGGIGRSYSYGYKEGGFSVRCVGD